MNDIIDGGHQNGLIGKMTAVSEQRDELISILPETISDMPGCLSTEMAATLAGVEESWYEYFDLRASFQFVCLAG